MGKTAFLFLFSQNQTPESFHQAVHASAGFNISRPRRVTWRSSIGDEWMNKCLFNEKHKTQTRLKHWSDRKNLETQENLSSELENCSESKAKEENLMECTTNSQQASIWEIIYCAIKILIWIFSFQDLCLFIFRLLVQLFSNKFSLSACTQIDSRGV